MWIVFVAALFGAAPLAEAKVEGANANGFSVAYEADLAIAPDTAYAKFVEIGQWWNAEHTYSGDAKNLSIDAAPGGAWSEKLPNGFVKHLDVINAERGQLLVFSGALGPLAFMGVAGSMVVTFEQKENGSHVTLRYSVGGYDPAGFKELPAAVDGVLGAGFDSYTKFAVK